MKNGRLNGMSLERLVPAIVGVVALSFFAACGKPGKQGTATSVLENPEKAQAFENALKTKFKGYEVDNPDNLEMAGLVEGATLILSSEKNSAKLAIVNVVLKDEPEVISAGGAVGPVVGKLENDAKTSAKYSMQATCVDSECTKIAVLLSEQASVPAPTGLIAKTTVTRPEADKDGDAAATAEKKDVPEQQATLTVPTRHVGLLFAKSDALAPKAGAKPNAPEAAAGSEILSLFYSAPTKVGGSLIKGTLNSAETALQTRKGKAGTPDAAAEGDKDKGKDGEEGDELAEDAAESKDKKDDKDEEDENADGDEEDADANADAKDAKGDAAGAAKDDKAAEGAVTGAAKDDKAAEGAATGAAKDDKAAEGAATGAAKDDKAQGDGAKDDK